MTTGQVRALRMTQRLMPLLVLLSSVPASTGIALAQSAQPYPNRPLRFIIPFTPGGSNDIFGRIIGQRLSEAMGQPVLIDNRPGAGGLLGAGIVA